MVPGGSGKWLRLDLKDLMSELKSRTESREAKQKNMVVNSMSGYVVV